MKGLNYVIAGLETISLKIDKSSAGKERTPTPFTEGEWQVLSTKSLNAVFLHVCALEWYFELLKSYKHVSTQMGSAKLKWVFRINVNEHLKKIPVGWRLVL